MNEFNRYLLKVSFLVVIISLCIGSALADYKQAVAYYNQGKYDKAIQEIKPEVEANPNWEFGHRLLGLCYLNTKNYTLAIASLTRAVQLKSTAFSTYAGLAEAYFNTGKYNNVIEILTVGEKYARPEDRYRIVHLRGAANFRLKKYAEAVEDLTEAVKLSSKDFADFSQLGIAYHFLGRYDEALSALNRAAELNSDDALTKEFTGKTYQRRGLELLKQKQYARAVDDLNKALSYAPNDGTTHYNLGVAHLALNQYDAAEKALVKATEIMPDNAEALYRLGFAYEKKKQLTKALDTYKRAYQLKNDPTIKESIDRVTELMAQSQNR